MKTGIRMAICMVLMATAATMASITISSFYQRNEVPTAPSAYVLGIADGNVAVFSGSDLTIPVTVTEIEASLLRESDQQLLSEGIPADSREELMALLEDLGC